MSRLTCLFALILGLFLTPANAADEEIVVPPRPVVEPLITYPYELDTDLDGIDDAITTRIRTLQAAADAEPDAQQRAAILQQLQEPVGVELLFAEPITAADLQAFLALGGKVEHVFRHVSYGWGGRLPLVAALQVPAHMSRGFLCVLLNRPMFPDLDEATRTGRVRPVWAAGFAGSPSGFTGNANTSIAILDTGVDGTHTDLTGRMRYWKDWGNSSPTAVDYDGHGTHVAAIALGTGAVLGASPTQLRFTDSGDLSSIASGSFRPAPLHLPAISVTLSMTATWLGGGQGTLGYAYGDNYAYSYTIGTPTSSGTSPRSVSANFTGWTTRHYSTYLTKKTSSDTITRYAVASSVTYRGVGDGFNALSGVAPGCYWVGHKVYNNDGSGGDTATVGYALDECIAYNTTYNIKVVNLSLSTAEPHSPTRNKVNTCAANGLVVTVSAGNTGPSTAMTDPGRASLAITSAASSDAVALTVYSATGNFTQETNTDYKPDLCPPGGSRYHSYILAADTNQSDASSQSFADAYANDYASRQGTSMAAGFAAGAAALVIQALEARGLSWSYTSSDHPRLVKMLLCATATETNANREGGTNNPTLGRAAAPKDIYEGYGAINVDAAIEAAYQSMAPGETIVGTTSGDAYDRRAWARRMELSAGSTVQLNLDVPSGADYDLYLYSGTPDEKGNPIILASSTNASAGTDEQISYVPSVSGTAHVVVKRISGSGAWSLTWTSTDHLTVTVPNGGETWRLASSHDIQWTYSGDPGSTVRIELLQGGSVVRTITDSAPAGSGGSGSYTWNIPTDLTPAANYRIRVTSTSVPAMADTSDADFTLAKSLTTVTVSDASGRPGDSVNLQAVLRDGAGNPLSGKSVAFTVAGTAAGSASTGSDGTATLAYVVPDNLGAGGKTLEAAFAGDATYEASSGSAVLTVNPAPTTLWTVNREGTITEQVILRQYDLKRTTDNALLVNKTIIYRVDGTQVGTAQTNSGGDSALTWIIPAGSASRPISVEFAGDEVYSASSASATLSCYTWATKMASFDRTVRISGRTELKARLVRSDNVPLYNKTINFYVDGTFVIARPTNTDGYASYPYYDVPDGAGAGIRTILSEWPGNAGYLPVSKTAKLTVQKAIPYIWVMPRSVPRGGIAKFYAYFRRLYDYKKQEGKTVSWYLDGTWVADVTTGSGSVDPGIARYNYDTSGLSVGDHVLRCEFAGDAWVDAGAGQATLTIY